MTRKRKTGIGVGLVLIAAIAIGVALAIPSCSIAENSDSSGNDTLSSITGAAIDADSARGEADNAPGGLSGAEVGSITNHGSETENAGSNAPGSSRTSAGTNNSGSDGSQSAKHWITDYRQVWVEDSPAWDEQIPIYDQVEISVCNICGASISGYEASHAKAHMLAGEGSGHHSEVVFNVVGYNTIHHDATGHYEAVEDGGHWES